MWEKLKGGMGVLLGLGVMVALVFVGALLIEGGARLSVVVYPWLSRAAGIAFTVALFVLFPMSFIRPARSFSSAGLMISSYVIGLALWVWALILTYVLWGLWAVVIGLFFMGVGIVPIA